MLPVHPALAESPGLQIVDTHTHVLSTYASCSPALPPHTETSLTLCVVQTSKSTRRRRTGTRQSRTLQRTSYRHRESPHLWTFEIGRAHV